MTRANEAFLKLATAETKIASSRGAVAGKAQVVRFRDMLATARDRMAAMVGKGMSEEEALAAKPFASMPNGPATSGLGRPLVWEQWLPHQGGLLSYGSDPLDKFRSAASYVDSYRSA